jgi:membrane protease YdiL (CAAX protease family)
MRWFELCLVLFLSFGGSVYSALYTLEHGPASQVSNSPARVLFATAQSAATLVLLGYVLSRTGRRFRDIGLCWSWRDVGIGLLVFAAAIGAVVFASRSIYAVHFYLYGTLPVHHRSSEFFGHFSWVLLPYFLVGPVHEELIVRAYLMTEIRELTGSTLLATLTSIIFQFSYHLYYGWAGALTVTSMFVIYALYFAKWKRVLPVLVAHELYDLIGVFRL